MASTRADTYTAGIVISPHYVEGLTLNCDFFHVDESRLIGTMNATDSNGDEQSRGRQQFLRNSHFIHPPFRVPVTLMRLLNQSLRLAGAHQRIVAATRACCLDIGESCRLKELPQLGQAVLPAFRAHQHQ